MADDQKVPWTEAGSLPGQVTEPLAFLFGKEGLEGPEELQGSAGAGAGFALLALSLVSWKGPRKLPTRKVSH